MATCQVVAERKSAIAPTMIGPQSVSKFIVGIWSNNTGSSCTAKVDDVVLDIDFSAQSARE